MRRNLDERLHSYLLKELRWEMEQHKAISMELAETSLEQAVVLSCSGYTALRIQVQLAVFDVCLSWRKDVPPIIKKL